MNYASSGELASAADLAAAHGVSVVVEPRALMHLIGTTMDYEENAVAAEFTFTNPNAKGQCGCGESFNV